MIAHGKEVKILALNSNPKLAAEIAARLDLKVSKAEAKTFSDGEIAVNIYETMRGADAFVVQSICAYGNASVNDAIMELLIMIDALKRASAGRITAVVPYLGYARQDRKAKARDPISAKLVADIITAAGADRALTMDLHTAQIQGFFNIHVDHLRGAPLLANYFRRRFKGDGENTVVVSPDLGSVTRARDFASRLDLPIAIIDKRRPKPNVSEVMSIIGEISGKTCILVDDMIDTAGTLTHGAAALMERGAARVLACATHGVLSGPAVGRIEESPIEELVLIDAVPLSEDKRSAKIHTLSSADIFAQAIRRIYNEESVSELFQ
jgi:ribose-phosphate pyrophosphokinase